MRTLIAASLAILMTSAVPARAVDVPHALSLGGNLYLPDGSPVTVSSVDFRVDVRDAAGTCVLYTETHLHENLSLTDGHFNLTIGAGSASVNNVSASTTLDAAIFANHGVTNVANCASPTVNLNGGDERSIQISYDLGAGYVTLSPAVPVVASAYALVAETLGGYRAADFLHVNATGSSGLNQTNTEYAFSGLNWPRLKALIDGTSSQYFGASPGAPIDFNNQRAINVAAPTLATDAANKAYVDANFGGKPLDVTAVGPMLGNGSTLLWDAAANKWVAGTIATSATGTAGGDLVGTYPNPQIANDVITSAKIKSTDIAINRLVITDGITGGTLEYAECLNLGYVFSWTATGWMCTSVASLSPVTSVAGKTGTVTLNAADIGMLGTAALLDHGTAAGNVPQLLAGGGLPALDGSALTMINAVALQSRAIASTAPNPGQVLGWNNTSSAWEPVTVAATGIQSLSTGTGLVGGVVTTNGTISADVGVTANKLVQLNASAQVPAVDGSLLTFVNAVKLQSRSVSAAMPAAGQVLGWNAVISAWEPILASSGSVINISSGLGLLGGPIATSGTLSVDVGTGANQIVQLNAGAQLPAVDGSLLTDVNAVKLQSRAVSNAAPAGGQTLAFNAALSQWEPSTAANGTVTTVASGSGLLGGPISTNGTLSVDTGTTGNKILQLNAGAQVPAVDGSLLTSVNAVKLQARDVASTQPTVGQVLGWNSSASQWEPVSGTAGAVTNVASGVGLLGGPITSNGTLNVDVGTGANQIVQLSAGAQLPAVDGSLLTSVNAVKLQSRAISSVAPTAGQTLAFNATSSQWEPSLASVGTLTTVASGNGLLGGPITVNGTLSVDTGTTANKILQLNAGAQIPAVDGSLLTSVNAVKLQTRTVAATQPTTGQVLGWNTSLTQWEPVSGTAGAVTNVASGVGLLGGPITSNGTLNVDVGTGANKIVQLNGSAQIPGVDGSLLTQINAVKLQTRNVALTAPNSGQVLGWNAATSIWEPTSTSVGTVTNVASGNGLLGGPINSNGTLSVDVGTGANKIVQLNASAQLPAVDGSLLTQINAVKLQARTVAATQPTTGQVLGWNTSLTQWEPVSGTAGAVTNVASGVGLLGGPITSNGTLNVDVGTGANKIVQLNAGAQLPAVDGSLLTFVNAVKLQTRSVAITAPAGGQVLGWNASTSVWEPTSTSVGSVTNVASGVGLLGGPITSNGTLNVDVGTGANKIVQLNGSAQLPAVDGSLLSQVNAIKLQTRTVAATQPTTGQVLGWNTSLTQWEPVSGTAGAVTNVASGVGLLGGPITSNGTLNVDVGTGANKIVQLNASAQLPAVDGSLLTSVNAVKLQTRNVAVTAPNPGQVLGWNAATSVWEPTSGSVGTVTNVAGGTGILGGPITSNGTLSVDVGTGANKIVQLNGSAQIPAIDGSLLTFVNAVKLQTRSVAITAPAGGQVLGWNAATSVWEPTSTSVGSVTNVAGGVGILGGPITSNGTLSVDVGTGANKIVQLNASAQLPAVDGSLLTQINAVKLQARTVAATQPTTGQVLGWNTSLTQWEPVSGTAGAVTNVASGVGLLGGPITSNGTLNVDVGTGANKIVQLNASAQLPAVDGSLLTLVNAVKLQTRNVAVTAPNAGQVLGWNAATSIWEPTSTSVGSVTNVASGTGLLGGPISSNGTLSVDVGTGANKILQLNASAQIPAVDGSLLTQVNAVKLQTRTVAATQPTTGQVLGWNTSLTQWEPVSGTAGAVTNVASGIGLLGGPITSNGTLNVDVGTGANKIVQLNASAQLPALDGSLLTLVNAVKLQTRSVAVTAPNPGQVLGWNASTSVWEPTSTSVGSVTNVASGTGLLGGPITANGTLSVDVGTGANKIVQLNGSAQLPAVDGSQLTQVNAVKLQTRAVSATAPTAGQTLAFNATLSQWEPSTASAGTVTNVATGNGLLGGPITSNGTLAVDTGTGANKILQLNASALIPAVDGSLLTSVNAVKLQTRAVSATAPTAGQTLAFNATLSQWEPSTASAGSVTNVASGTGLLGGPITSNGTLNVDVGTGANKIVQLNGSAQLPAIDGSLLTFVNAVKLQTRAVASTQPTAGQVLGWNTTLTQWEPVSGTAGAVVSVASGVGLLGGPITSNGTLNVDVGTAANKIVQLNGSAQIPAVDGSLLTQVNAVKLQTRAISATAPTAGQTLAFNATLSQWEPSTASAGSVTNVASGNGLLGGPITSNGTLAVDTGTGAIKILQLNASAQIPAVDGSLLTSVNAVKLQTRTVAATQPTTGQVLGWNTTLTQWEPVSGTAGAVVSVASGVGLTGGPITSNGTLNVDVGTGANKIVQLNGAAQIPAIDGSLLSQVNAVKLQTRAVSATAPTAGQTLAFNATLSQWEPSTASAGSVTTVASGTGLTGGPITSNGTLNVDVGTGANKIVQLNASAQLPAIDGSLLTFVNAVKLQTRAIASTQPTAGQVLGWNTTLTQWEPTSGTAGAVVSVASGVGLLGGPITSNGTLNVDVGSAANKIVQENANAQIAQLGGTAAQPGYSFVGATGTGLFSTGTGTLGFATNGSPAMTIVNGNIGINSTTPFARVDIADTFNGSGSIRVTVNDSGAFNVASPAYTTQFTNQNNGAGHASIGMPVGFGGGAVARNAIVATRPTATSGALTFYNDVAGTLTPTFTTTLGRAGVGTMTPQAGLDIATTGTGGSAVLIPRDTSANRPSAPVNGMLRYNNDLNVMEGYIAGAWSALSSGSAAGTVTNVAGGTGILGGPITTNGTLSVDVGTGANKIVQENANAQIAQAAGTVANPSYSFAGNTAAGMYAPGTNQITLVTNGTARLQIDAAGKVGVGEASTGARLHVPWLSGDSSPTAFFGSNNGSNNQIAVNAQSWTATGVYGASFSGRGISGVSNSNSGVYGESTNSYGVRGSSSGSSSAYYQSGSNTNTAPTVMIVQTGTSGADLEQWVDQSSKVVMVVNPSGRVGIGTSSALAGLDVSTTGPLSSILLPRDTTANRPAGVNGMLRYNNTLNVMEGYIGGAWTSLGASAGSLTGSGTTNYVPKFTGTSAVGNSLIYDDGTNIGIGTSTTSAKLTVSGDIVSNRIIPSGGSVAFPTYAFSPTNNSTGMYAPATNILGFATNGVERLRMDAAGRVGIGTSSLSSDLSFDGNALRQIGMERATSATAYPLTILAGSAQGGASNGNGGPLILSSGFATGAGGSSVELRTATPSASGTNDVVPTTKMTISGSGNVGIGTSGPQALLDIFGAGANSAVLIPRDTTANRPTGVNGMLRYNTTSLKFEAFENGAWANMIGGGSSLSFPLLAPNGSNTAPVYSFANSTTTGIFSPSTNQLSLTANGVVGVTIDGSGNVGIGTTAPTATFDVNKQTLLVRGNASSAGEIRLQPGPSVGSNYVGFVGPATNPASNVLWRLPAADGTSGQVLTTNGSATLTWSTPAGGGGGSIGCGDYSTNQARLMSSTSNYWAAFCFIGSSTSFQNTNWVGRTATNHAAATLACANEGADLCSASDLKKAFSTSAGSSGLTGVQMWTSTMGYVSQTQNPQTCSTGNCQPQEWQPYVFNNGNLSNGHVDLAQQQYQYFCCRH